MKKATKNAKQEPHEKYRWFLTSSKKRVIGGKNADQNEEIIQDLIESDKNYTILHTKQPGSPFAIIESTRPSKKDREQAAIFCSSYSQDYRDNKNNVIVHVFKAEDVYKAKRMKIGTFGVKKFTLITAKKQDIAKFKKKIEQKQSKSKGK